MSIIHAAYEGITEMMVFALVVIVLFNTLTDFAAKMGIITNVFDVIQTQYFGLLSAVIALYNAISKKFFGLTLFHA